VKGIRERERDKGQFHQQLYLQFLCSNILCSSISISPTISGPKLCKLACQIYDISGLNSFTICQKSGISRAQMLMKLTQRERKKRSLKTASDRERKNKRMVKESVNKIDWEKERGFYWDRRCVKKRKWEILRENEWEPERKKRVNINKRNVPKTRKREKKI